MPDYETKGSETQDSWDTGMKRGASAGKGRPDLISPIALRRLAGVYERGGEHYDDRNWERGGPISRFIESGMRHMNQYREGYRDEDHLTQAVWNFFAAIHAEEMILKRRTWPAELYDQPCYVAEREMDESTRSWWASACKVTGYILGTVPGDEPKQGRPEKVRHSGRLIRALAGSNLLTRVS